MQLYDYIISKNTWIQLNARARDSALYVHIFSVKGPREQPRISALSLSVPSTHDPRVTHIVNMKLFARVTPFMIFARLMTIASRESWDWSVERSISNWSHASRSIQVDCRYAAPICSPLRLSLSLSLSPPHFSDSFLLLLSLACFSYLRPFLSTLRCAGICEIDRERSITPHIFVSEKYINIHSYGNYAIVTYSGLAQKLMIFLFGFFLKNWNCLAIGSYVKLSAIADNVNEKKIIHAEINWRSRIKLLFLEPMTLKIERFISFY